jgi:hypothetical protein
MRRATIFLAIACLAASLPLSGVTQERSTINPALLNGLEWRALGPPRGGRVTAVAGDAQNPLVTLNGAASWSTQHNQPTAALFGLAIDDQVPYRLYAAQNDNTHISTPSRTCAGAIAWSDNEVLAGGESGQTAVKPDGSVVYAADRAGIDRIDRRTGQATHISVWPDDEFTLALKDVKYRFYYTFPMLLSPHDSNVLYTAGHRVYRATNEGAWWDAVSCDVTKNRQDKMQNIPGGPITSMWSSL